MKVLFCLSHQSGSEAGSGGLFGESEEDEDEEEGESSSETETEKDKEEGEMSSSGEENDVCCLSVFLFNHTIMCISCHCTVHYKKAPKYCHSMCILCVRTRT